MAYNKNASPLLKNLQITQLCYISIFSKANSCFPTPMAFFQTLQNLFILNWGVQCCPYTHKSRHMNNILIYKCNKWSSHSSNNHSCSTTILAESSIKYANCWSLKYFYYNLKNTLYLLHSCKLTYCHYGIYIVEFYYQYFSKNYVYALNCIIYIVQEWLTKCLGVL